MNRDNEIQLAAIALCNTDDYYLCFREEMLKAMCAKNDERRIRFELLMDKRKKEFITKLTDEQAERDKKPGKEKKCKSKKVE